MSKIKYISSWSIIITCCIIFNASAVLAQVRKPVKQGSTQSTQAAKPSTKAAKPSTQPAKPVVTLTTWKNLKDFVFPKLMFHKTTDKVFNTTYPFIKNFEDADQSIRIYTYHPGKTSGYVSIKFGFEDNILSWIDYDPVQNVKLTDVIEVYGTPLSINTRVSKYLDYYDYGEIVIALTKDTDQVFTFTQYGKENVSSNNAKVVNLKLPSWQNLSNGRVDKLVPGQTTKSSLKSLYPALKEVSLPTQASVKNALDNFENNENFSPAIYHISEGLENTDFKRVELFFNDNVLSWVDLVPKKLTLAQAVTIFGNNYKVDSKKENVDFYNFKNVILTVSKKSKIVLNIGLLGSINSSIRDALVSMEDLNSKPIKNIKVGSTTLNDFNKHFPGLVASRQKEANTLLVKVSEGVSSKGYASVLFVFHNNKLTSVDFVPKMEIQIANIIKYYGNKYELDNKSDQYLEFYTFDNVIVSVYKDSKIVNSIGIF